MPSEIIKVVVIGGANLDLRGRPQGLYVRMTSNPGTVRRWPGGAGRNLAENLARLGARVSLLSAVGDDEPGRYLLAATAETGVDVSQVFLAKDRPTGSYLAILDEFGNMMSAISDTQVLEEVTAEYLSRNIVTIQEASLVLFDANLLPTTIEKATEISKSNQVPLAAVPVSVAKAARLAPHLKDIEYLFCQKAEAEVLLGGSHISDKQDSVRAAKDLVGRGVETVVITQGGRGVAYATAKDSGHLPAWPTQTVDASGAGDSLAAATLFGLLSGKPLVESLNFGLAAAALTVQGESTVSPDLSLSQLRQMVAEKATKQIR